MARRIIRRNYQKARRVIRPGIRVNRFGNVGVVVRDEGALSFAEARSIAKKSR